MIEEDALIAFVSELRGQEDMSYNAHGDNAENDNYVKPSPMSGVGPSNTVNNNETNSHLHSQTALMSDIHEHIPTQLWDGSNLPDEVQLSKTFAAIFGDPGVFDYGYFFNPSSQNE